VNAGGEKTDVGGVTLTVVVVAYGSSAMLAEALETLGAAYPVIVVDNASSPVTRDVAIRFGATYDDPGANLGFAAAVNRGIARIADPSGDVLLLNPDARITAPELERLHALLHGAPDLAAVAPSLHADASGRPARARWPWHTPAGAWIEAIGLSRWRLSSSSYFLGGAVLLLRREALTDIGVLDERFFLYGEDEDWQKRACARGWRVRYCPEVAAVHFAGGTEHDPARLQLRLHAATERYLRKWYGSGGWLVYRVGTVLGYSARALTARGWRRATAVRLVKIYLAGPDRAAVAAGAVPGPPR
jgi:GT2 family glycosyltransferase